jgi:hypothetical protein
LLTDLLGKDVSAAIQKLPKSTGTGVVAGYYDDAENLAAVVVCGMELAAGAAAALAMFPAAAAKEQAASGKLDENLWETLSEVLNVASRWFNANEATHVRFRELYYAKDTLPADVKALLTAPATSVHADVTVKGYGTGLLDLLAA